MKYNAVNDVTEFLNVVTSSGCAPFINIATRVKDKSATCLDHVYSNLDPNLLVNHVIRADISDHYSTYTRVQIDFRCSSDYPKYLYVRKKFLNKKEAQELCSDLYSRLKSNDYTSLTNVNDKAEFIASKYNLL